jgi:hypothetical protein
MLVRYHLVLRWRGVLEGAPLLRLAPEDLVIADGVERRVDAARVGLLLQSRGTVGM